MTTERPNDLSAKKELDQVTAVGAGSDGLLGAIWEEGTPATYFDCDSAVFAKRSCSSLCYTTSRTRAKWIANRLNEVREFRFLLSEVLATQPISEAARKDIEAALTPNTKDEPRP